VSAEMLLTRRRIETWYLWIAVNLMSIILYVSRGLYVTAALYCVLLGLATWSFTAWRAAEKARQAAALSPTLPADAAVSTAR